MGWIARTVMRSLKRAEAEIQIENRDVRNAMIGTDAPECAVKEAGVGDVFNNPVRIEIVTATGGKIIRFSKYDRHHDRNNEATYVIPQEDDFTESMTKLINLELMKQ